MIRVPLLPRTEGKHRFRSRIYGNPNLYFTCEHCRYTVTVDRREWYRIMVLNAKSINTFNFPPCPAVMEPRK